MNSVDLCPICQEELISERRSSYYKANEYYRSCPKICEFSPHVEKTHYYQKAKISLDFRYYIFEEYKITISLEDDKHYFRVYPNDIMQFIAILNIENINHFGLSAEELLEKAKMYLALS